MATAAASTPTSGGTAPASGASSSSNKHTSKTSTHKDNNSSSSSSSSSSNEINLRLILVSGKTKDFPFLSSDSAGDIAKYVFDNWPDGKKERRNNNSGKRENTKVKSYF